MDEREFEQMLGQVMKHDFSAGSEAFRDALLERCLGELASDEDGVSTCCLPPATCLFLVPASLGGPFDGSRESTVSVGR